MSYVSIFLRQIFIAMFPTGNFPCASLNICIYIIGNATARSGILKCAVVGTLLDHHMNECKFYFKINLFLLSDDTHLYMRMDKTHHRSNNGRLLFIFKFCSHSLVYSRIQVTVKRLSGNFFPLSIQFFSVRMLLLSFFKIFIIITFSADGYYYSIKSIIKEKEEKDRKSTYIA